MLVLEVPREVMPLPRHRPAVEALEDLDRKTLFAAVGPQMPVEIFLVGKSLAALRAYLWLRLLANLPPV